MVNKTIEEFDAALNAYAGYLAGKKMREEILRLEKLDKELTIKYQSLLEFYDNHVGTPCAQIGWRNERDSLNDQIEALKRELMEVKSDCKHCTLPCENCEYLYGTEY